MENRYPDLFAMVVWVVWKRRNDIRVGKSCETLPNLMQQARSKLREFMLHNNAEVGPVGRPPTQWQPLAHQQYKMAEYQPGIWGCNPRQRGAGDGVLGATNPPAQ